MDHQPGEITSIHGDHDSQASGARDAASRMAEKPAARVRASREAWWHEELAARAVSPI